MLKFSINNYIFTGLFFFLLALFYGQNSFFLIDSFNLLYFLIYSLFLVLIVYLYRKENQINILLFYILVSAFFIVILNFISYNYTGNYFVFDETDPVAYDEYSKLINYNLDNIKQVKQNYGFDDWGAFAVISSVYMIYPNNLTLNVFFWILGIFTAYNFFKLAKNFMPNQYAIYATISFFLSSFALWYEASGRKETIMVFLVVMSYKYYYDYLKSKKLLTLLVCIFFTTSLVFFRSAIPVFIFASFIITQILQIKNKTSKLVLVILSIILVFTLSFFIEAVANRYLFLESDRDFFEIKQIEGTLIGNVYLSYFVNFLSALFGPFPTFLTKNLHYLSIFASGAYFKCIISFPILIGSFYILKNKIYYLFPVLLFPLFEMMSLVAVFEALELRKSLPHFPMLYIIAFWFFFKFKNINNWKKKNRDMIKLLWHGYFIILFFIVIIWNYRTSILSY